MCCKPRPVGRLSELLDTPWPTVDLCKTSKILSLRLLPGLVVLRSSMLNTCNLRGESPYDIHPFQGHVTWTKPTGACTVACTRPPHQGAALHCIKQPCPRRMRCTGAQPKIFVDQLFHIEFIATMLTGTQHLSMLVPRGQFCHSQDVGLLELQVMHPQGELQQPHYLVGKIITPPLSSHLTQSDRCRPKKFSHTPIVACLIIKVNVIAIP